ncbi:MAG: DUF262 domain-containing protein [Syntrophomonadaceae bacterium]|jgi:hypothetical protein
MSYKPVSLKSLICQKNNPLLLPHIQRPFTWEIDQIFKLLDSLMNNYPIQTILLWRTREYVNVRRFMNNIEEVPDLSRFYDIKFSQRGIEKLLVIDGQHRLQSLFAVFDGFIYDSEVYMNLLSGNREVENGVWYEFKLSQDKLQFPYIRLKDLVADNRSLSDITSELNKQLAEHFNNCQEGQDIAVIKNLFSNNIRKLVSIIREEKYIWYKELDGVDNHYPYEKVLNIFFRANCGGTAFEPADLIFTSINQHWEDAEQNIKDIAKMLNALGSFEFSTTFVLKCIMMAIGEGTSLTYAMFERDLGADFMAKIQAKWQYLPNERIITAFKHLRNFIINDLKLSSAKAIRSYDSLIPIFEYLYLYSYPDPINIAYLKSYYYKAQVLNWFCSDTDSLLESIHHILVQNKTKDFPLDELCRFFSSNNRDVDITKEHLKDARTKHLVLGLLHKR